MRKTGAFMPSKTQVWEGQVVTVERAFEAARQAGPGAKGDVLDKREQELFPDDSSDLAARARVRSAIWPRARRASQSHRRAARPRHRKRRHAAIRAGAARALPHAWQVALQTWMEGVVPGERTFPRASRRGTDHPDVVLPGRKRYTWMLNVILDTSASMSERFRCARRHRGFLRGGGRRRDPRRAMRHGRHLRRSALGHRSSPTTR